MKSTAKVWPVIGTGVKGSTMYHWAANAVNAAAATTSTTDISAVRGKTLSVITAEVIV